MSIFIQTDLFVTISYGKAEALAGDRGRIYRDAKMENWSTIKASRLLSSDLIDCVPSIRLGKVIHQNVITVIRSKPDQI